MEQPAPQWTGLFYDALIERPWEEKDEFTEANAPIQPAPVIAAEALRAAEYVAEILRHPPPRTCPYCNRVYTPPAGWGDEEGCPDCWRGGD